MARPAQPASIEAILRDAAEKVVERVSAAISRQVADMVQQQLQRELANGSARRGARGGRARTELTRWVADARARRVPNFVIEATGLDTKKKIVAKFGAGAAFEKGKPLPKAKG